MVKELGGEYPAMLALCKRAHAGLLKSQAQLYLAPDQRLERVPVPAGFWWAEGEEALEQDWTHGDFSTWIDERFELKAFGVEFDFQGIQSMMTPQRAASAARELSVVSNADWLSAKEARTFVVDHFKLNPALAGAGLIDHCKLGFVPARAVLMQRSRNGDTQNFNLEVREWDIPSWFWQILTNSGKGTQEWERGLFSAHGSTPDGVFTYFLAGVHFEAAALEALAPRKPEARPEVAVNRVGRPPKEWWADLFCAVWGQIVQGELTPKNQADIERAMLDWVADRGEIVAESTVKPMARKVWLEWNREARN